MSDTDRTSSTENGEPTGLLPEDLAPPAPGAPGDETGAPAGDPPAAGDGNAPTDEDAEPEAPEATEQPVTEPAPDPVEEPVAEAEPEPELPRFAAPFSSPEPTAVVARPRRRATRPALSAEPDTAVADAAVALPPPAAAPAPAFVSFMAPAADAPAPPRRRGRRPAQAPEVADDEVEVDLVVDQDASLGAGLEADLDTDLDVDLDVHASGDEPPRSRRSRSRRSRSSARRPVLDDAEDDADDSADLDAAVDDSEDADAGEDRDDSTAGSRRRRRGRRGRGRGRTGEDAADTDDESADEADGAGDDEDEDTGDDPADEAGEDADSDEAEGGSTTRRRRRRRRRGASGGGEDRSEEVDDDDRPERAGRNGRTTSDDDVRGVAGSTRLEAKRQRRRDGRDTGRRRTPILTESEFLARREAVDRTMVIRQRGDRTQIAVLEDDVLVEHYVTQASATSFAGNVYLGRVQNVLPSMEAAFVDIGKGRNAVLYAGEVNWDAVGLSGKQRSIETALKSGDKVLVQVTKDPIGHKGARLTQQINLPGRFLVFVPGGSMTGISRKLPDTERTRLKDILKRIVPEDAGVIIRTAAEGASEEELTRDVNRLTAQWDVISKKAESTSSAPTLLYGEPDLAIRVIRDVFNEDFKELVVQGEDAWDTVEAYVGHVSPELGARLTRFTGEGDVFRDLRIDEQLAKALDRKVWLPSGGSLVIDRTEAMTVVDVNTGKFTGSGGNLEQTVTRNNMEAAEEIVRQLRLRDIGGIIVIDFIDMVLESNRDLVLRRLTECLGRDRTKHQVAEVTSLGLVQMTRKRVGQGLLEVFSEPCDHCRGRGILVHTDPVDEKRRSGAAGGVPVPGPGGPGSGRRDRLGAASTAAAKDTAKDSAKDAGKDTVKDAAKDTVKAPVAVADAAAPATGAGATDAPAADDSASGGEPAEGGRGRRSRGRRNRGQSGEERASEDAAVLAGARPDAAASLPDDAVVLDERAVVPEVAVADEPAVVPDEVLPADAAVPDEPAEAPASAPMPEQSPFPLPAESDDTGRDTGGDTGNASGDAPAGPSTRLPDAVEEPAPEEAVPLARPRRRRAASRPAGPPVS